MTGSDFLLYLKEGRHIFSVCPECSEVNRLTELELTTKGRYQRDWLDRLLRKEEVIQARIESLEERRTELETSAKEKAIRTILPKLLAKAAPSFVRRRIQPTEVRTLISPTQFVVFKGMYSNDGVREVAFLHVGPETSETKAMRRAIADRALGWNTIRLGEDGTITKVGAGSKQRRLDSFAPAQTAGPLDNAGTVANHAKND